MRPRYRMRQGHSGYWFDVPESAKEVSKDETIRLPELTSQERIRLVAELPAHPTMKDIQNKTVEILQRRTR